MTDHHLVKAVKAGLLARRYTADAVPRVDEPGVYAFFLVDSARLADIRVDQSGLLYVGMTESSLDVRNHFTHTDSGFSSLRRTLGAILKQQLELNAIPRGSGNSDTNTKNYRFSDIGERRLSCWMQEHLTYSFYLVAANDVGSIEDFLIKEMRPPLNLNRWKNPQRKHLLKMRDTCRDEARQNSSAGRSNSGLLNTSDISHGDNMDSTLALDPFVVITPLYGFSSDLDKLQLGNYFSIKRYDSSSLLPFPDSDPLFRILQLHEPDWLVWQRPPLGRVELLVRLEPLFSADKSTSDLSVSVEQTLLHLFFRPAINFFRLLRLFKSGRLVAGDSFVVFCDKEFSPPGNAAPGGGSNVARVVWIITSFPLLWTAYDPGETWIGWLFLANSLIWTIAIFAIWKALNVARGKTHSNRTQDERR